MKLKYHLFGSLAGGVLGGCIGYLLKQHEGALIAAIYGAIAGEIISVSFGLRKKQNKT